MLCNEAAHSVADGGRRTVRGGGKSIAEGVEMLPEKFYAWYLMCVCVCVCVCVCMYEYGTTAYSIDLKETDFR